MQKLPSRRPMVEQLETRTTPAVTASMSAGGVLTFIGDSNNGGDYVQANDDGAGNITASYGNFLSGPNNFATFSGIKKVVTTFAGNDLVGSPFFGPLEMGVPLRFIDALTHSFSAAVPAGRGRIPH